MYIMFSKKHKLMIITFARCGSKTILKWFHRIHGIHPPIKLHTETEKNETICANNLSNENIVELARKCTVYIVRRNPYDRIISDVLAHQVTPTQSFEQFILNTSDADLQIYSLVTPRLLHLSRCVPYKFIEFSTLKQTLELIRATHNILEPIGGNREFNNTPNCTIETPYKIPIRELPKYNDAVRDIPEWKHFYTSKLKTKISKVLVSDLKFFHFD